MRLPPDFELLPQDRGREAEGESRLDSHVPSQQRSRRYLVGGLVVLLAVVGLAVSLRLAARLGRGSSARPSEAIIAAASKSKPQGYLCWLVSLSSGTELELVQNHYKHKQSIFACDDSIVFSDRIDLSPITAVSIGNMRSVRAPWGGWYNTEVFLRAWDKLVQDGRFARREWIVKVDADAVFFSGRLPSHLSGLDPLRPIFVKGGQEMLGAVEVFSNAAVQVFAHKRAHVCKEDTQGSGENGFIDQCMGLLGVKSSIDTSLLKSTTSVQDCSDDKFVVFHPFVDISSMMACYRTAVH